MTKPIPSQAKKRSQVMRARFDIITSVAASDAKGSHGDHGTLNRRGCSGSFLLKTITQMEAMAKAISVPMATRSDASPTLINPAQRATVAPQIQTDHRGVRVFGSSEEKTSGTIPSRDIAYQRRVWPYCRTNITENKPINMPAETTL